MSRRVAMGRMTSKVAIKQMSSKALTVQNQSKKTLPGMEPIAMEMGMSLGPR
jgi:hypothetical protein